MAYSKEIVDQVRELTEKGYSQRDIEAMLGVPERTQRYMKKKGLLEDISLLDNQTTSLYHIKQLQIETEIQNVKKELKKLEGLKCQQKQLQNQITQLRDREKQLTDQLTQMVQFKKSEDKYLWEEFTAGDLVNLFAPRSIPYVLTSLKIAKRQDNTRAHRFIHNLIEASTSNAEMPGPWLALVAGFPILADDIGAPSMAELAMLAKELQPYRDKYLRREYHRKAKPILIKLLAEAQFWLVDAAAVGGYPLGIMPSFMPGNNKPQGVVEAQEILIKGRWSPITRGGNWARVPLEKTSAGILYEILSRVPDPDKQKGKLIRKATLLALLSSWCFQAPNDFYPPLSQIKRRIHKDDPRTEGFFPSLYTAWKDDVEAHSNQDSSSLG